ncbi:MAG: PDZ domain-containing protein [Chloroflexota bacterium]|nr:PDZ domain-containing protein [Chloroflexota bacterium]
MEATVTLYRTSTCPWCDRAADFLRQRNVPFNEIDVSLDQRAAMEMVRRSGQQGVPVTVAGDEVILGFDQARLGRLADKLSAPKRKPLGILAADAEAYLARHPDLAQNVPAGTKGVFVGKIRPETVAETSGLQAGDIITGFAGKKLRSMSQLDQMVDALKHGDSATVRYLRNGSEETATLTF